MLEAVQNPSRRIGRTRQAAQNLLQQLWSRLGRSASGSGFVHQAKRHAFSTFGTHSSRRLRVLFHSFGHAPAKNLVRASPLSDPDTRQGRVSARQDGRETFALSAIFKKMILNFNSLEFGFHQSILLLKLCNFKSDAAVISPEKRGFQAHSARAADASARAIFYKKLL